MSVMMVKEFELLEQFRDLSLVCERTPQSVKLDRVRVSYLSNGADTDITLSASMDTHLHP